MNAETLTDRELLEAIDLAASRARLAAVDDLRLAADVLAGLALEAAARLRDVLELEGISRVTRPPGGPRARCVCGHAMFSHRFDGSGVCSECTCNAYGVAPAGATDVV